MSTLSAPALQSLRRLSSSFSHRSAFLPSSLLSARHYSPTVPRPVDHSRFREDAVAASPATWSLRDEGGGRLSFKDRKIVVDGVQLSPTHLRDHCRCPKCFHPVTHQRLLDTFSIPKDIHPTTMSLTSEGLEIVWSDSSHPSFYPTYLLKNLSPSPPVSFIPSNKILWTPTTDLTTFPNSISHSSLLSPSSSISESAVLQALRTVDTQGVLFVTGVPATTEATEKVCRILGKGKLRNTHYEEFWDFTADMKRGDLAYSNEPLRPHTDTSYFSSPCGLQIFHLLSHPSPPGTGGHTLLVDAFSCASQLRELHPAAYEILRDTKRKAHAAGSEGYLYRTEKGYGVFEEGVGGVLESVRWNGEDRSVFSEGVEGEGGVEEVEKWYEAVRLWEGLLRKKENEKWVRLTGGVVCVIDNHRVMHGRSAFTGERRMCGAYIDRDEWRSYLAVLEREERKKMFPLQEEELEY